MKLARDPDVQNEELIKTFQRSYSGARKVRNRAEQVSANRPQIPYTSGIAIQVVETFPASDDRKSRTPCLYPVVVLLCFLAVHVLRWSILRNTGDNGICIDCGCTDEHGVHRYLQINRKSCVSAR